MRQKYLPEDDQSAYELDFAPMLALMVTLIPILLLTSVFVHVKVISSDLPQAVQQAIQEQKENPEEHASILLEVSSTKGFVLTTTYKGKVDRKDIPLAGDKTLDQAGLYEALLIVKSEHPQVFTLRLYPRADVPYEQIVQVIDVARRARAGTAFQVKNTQGDPTTTELMFPDVVFANVLEG